jgi:tetratricopeptide (TPR) repeat protein
MKWLLVLLIVITAAAATHDSVQQANQALEDENFNLAAELLEKVLDESPDDHETRFQLAYAYTRLEQPDKAIENYRQVVEAQPDITAAQANLSLLLMQTGRAPEALPHLKAVTETRPDDVHFQLFLAQALRAAERFDEAVPAFERTLELDVTSIDAILGLGQTLEQSERFAEAADAYRKAAAIDPKITNMLLGLAETMEERGDIDHALSLYREYLSTNGDAIDVRERVGILLMNQKRYEDAITELTPVVERQPTPANLEALAQAFLMTDRRGEALPLLRSALRNDPSNVELLIRYANVLLHAGESEKAAQHYYTAVKGAPDHVDAWNGLAFALYKLENFPGTLKALAQAKEKAPPKPAAVYLRAITEDKIRLYEQALASYQEFLATSPSMEDEEWKSQQRIKVIKRVLEPR